MRPGTLSQLEYIRNNFEASLEWAHVAADHGLVVRKWHMDFLEALTNVDIVPLQRPAGGARAAAHRPAGRSARRSHGQRTKHVIAIVDSGAVMSIVSRKFADSVPIRKLGTFEGTSPAFSASRSRSSSGSSIRCRSAG